jgi:amino acid adenylation domain-containing protein
MTRERTIGAWPSGASPDQVPPTAAYGPLLHRLVDAAARQTPNAIAVECAGRTLRYGELESQSNRLARRLRALGVLPEARVAILVDRSVEMVVAVLAVLKAGGAYVPIHPENPAERVAYLLGDSSPSAIILNERLRGLLPSQELTIVSLEKDGAEIERESTDALDDDIDPDALAYVIYTSGSTGKPKGVQIEHRNVVQFLDGLSKHIRFAPGDVHAGVASLSFDIAGLDIYATLSSGARLLIVPQEIIPQPSALLAHLRERGATSLQATPTAWRMLVDAGWTGDPPLRVLCGGEALPQALADSLTATGLEVWNLYGPTEATIWACLTRLAPNDAVTLGHPLAGTTAHVLDEQGAPVPPGGEGLLHLGGGQLARGYFNRPELTAERFIPDVFSVEPGARLYNTGDVVRVRTDGKLEYVGRRDDQVKVRGFRIELGEIEAALLRHEQVRAAAVVVQRDSADADPRLIAYVTLRRPEPVRMGEARSSTAAALPIDAEVRRFTSEVLPPHMVPERVIVLGELPVTSSGKIDRVALAQLRVAQAQRAPRHAPYVAPSTERERSLVAMLEEILDVRPIGVTDNVFELGATSVAAARLFNRVERTLGVRLPLAPLFEAPTVEQLARLVDGNGSSNGDRRFTSLVRIQPRGARPPIVCVHGGAGTILHLKPLAEQLGEDQPFFGLQMQGLAGDRPMHTSVREMARHYVRELRAALPRGPYVVAGYCFGAIVAQEMARLLSDAGADVPLLISINGPAPAYIRRYGAASHTVRPPRTPWVYPPPRDRLDALLRPAKRVWWWITFRRTFGFRGEWYAMKRRIRLLGVRIESALGRPIDDGRRERAVFEITAHLERDHVPAPWRGRMLVLQAEGIYHQAGLGWSDVDGTEVEPHVLPGWHDSQRSALYQPSVTLVAELIRGAIDRVRSAGV